MADLTDSELVTELQEYGENITLPIKAKQRPILVKKLNHLRVRHRKQQEAAVQDVRRNKRKSFPQPSPSRPTLTSNSLSTGADDSDSVVHSTATNSLNRYQASRRSSFRGNNGTASNLDALSSDDSDVEGPVKDTPNKALATPRTKIATRSQNSKLTDSALRTLRRRTGDFQSKDLSPDKSPSNDNVSLTEKRNYQSRRSMPSPARSGLYPDLSFFNSFSQNVGDNFESSDSDGEQGSSYFVENKSMNTSFASHLGGRRDGSYVSHANTSGILPSSSNSSPASSFSSSPHHSQLLYGGKNRANRVQPYRSRFADFLPKILISLVVGFFVVVSLSYAFMHKDSFFAWFSQSDNLGSNDNLLVCKNGFKQGCYDMAELQKTLPIIQNLFEDLSKKKGRVLCEDDPVGSDVMSSSFLKIKIDTTSFASTQADRLYECCVQHILINPHWNIRALRDDGTVARTVSEVSTLEATIANMSFACRLKRSFSSVIYGLFTVGILGALATLVTVYVKYSMKEKEKEQADVYAMVEKIIELVHEHHDQTKADGSEDPYLVVQHARDQLLPPAKRRQQNHLWDKAVSFIAANESRILHDTKIIKGEEFDVWHWIQPSHHNGKMWQGSALSDSNQSNEVVYSPSPCLKIRNMFDSAVESDDHWEEGVKDAILEKCSTIPSVVHVYVDVNSSEGCVYLKCSSCEAAGKVRKALNSWWFDGRLVTVKHLKADYYHKKWPESRNASLPLKPSTSLMRSVSQSSYRSSLEMT